MKISRVGVDLAKNVFQVCALDDRYLILNAGQTVLDLQTGLEWMRCIPGQVWNGSTCEMTEARQQDGINYQRDKIAALTGAKNKAQNSSTNAITGMLSQLGGGMLGF